MPGKKCDKTEERETCVTDENKWRKQAGDRGKYGPGGPETRQEINKHKRAKSIKRGREAGKAKNGRATDKKRKGAEKERGKRGKKQDESGRDEDMSEEGIRPKMKRDGLKRGTREEEETGKGDTGKQTKGKKIKGKNCSYKLYYFLVGGGKQWERRMTFIHVEKLKNVSDK